MTYRLMQQVRADQDQRQQDRQRHDRPRRRQPGDGPYRGAAQTTATASAATPARPTARTPPTVSLSDQTGGHTAGSDRVRAAPAR